MKTSELIGPALDLAVAKANGLLDFGVYVDAKLICGKLHFLSSSNDVFNDPYSPSTDWSQGGPIIERESITIRTNALVKGHWAAFIDYGSSNTNIKARQSGPTPLIAAMRCYVASELGEEIEVPNELINRIA